jgi:hypothetical protein
MSERIVIGRRFNGPPQSAQGGYACGLVAGLVGGPAEVTLRRPPPLERPLAVRRLELGRVELRDGEDVVAEGVPSTVDLVVPEPIRPVDAEAAARGYPGFRAHAYPTCFACGPDRAVGDGLRIFPGPVAGQALMAAPWTPDPSWLDEDGCVRSEIVWAALDCPNGWATISLGDDVMERDVLLGRLAARIIRPMSGREPCVVMGWPITREKRKLSAGSAVFSADGELRAVARGLWIMRA